MTKRYQQSSFDRQRRYRSEMCQEYATGITVETLARHYSLSEKAVRYILRREGMIPTYRKKQRRRDRFSVQIHPQIDEIVQLKESGHTHQQIADILSLDTTSPRNYVNDHIKKWKKHTGDA